MSAAGKRGDTRRSRRLEEESGVVEPESDVEPHTGEPEPLAGALGVEEAESTSVDSLAIDFDVLVEHYLGDPSGEEAALYLVSVLEGAGVVGSGNPEMLSEAMEESRAFFAYSVESWEIQGLTYNFLEAMLAAIEFEGEEEEEEEEKEVPVVPLGGVSDFLEWQVVLPYDEQAVLRSGSDLLNFPPTLDIFPEGVEGDPLVSLSLNEKTARALLKAVEGAVDVYEEKSKKKISQSFKDVWHKFLEKNRSSRFLRYFNISVASVVVFVLVYGFYLVR